jgi:hypothetical protein
MPSSVCGRLTARPSTAITPDVGRMRPAMSMASVVLPQPEGPTIERNSPPRTSNEMPSRARTSPSGVGKMRVTSDTSTNFRTLSMSGQ